MSSKGRTLTLGAFCAYLAALSYVCFAKPDGLPDMPSEWFGIPIDKAVHFLMFVPYPVLAVLTFHKKNYGVLHDILIFSIVLVTGTALAIGTELIQSTTGYRSFEINDFYADALGMAVGAALAAGIIIYRRGKA